MKIIFSFLLLNFLFINFISAQNASQREMIMRNTDVQQLDILRAKFDDDYKDRQIRINNYLISNPSKKRFFFEGEVRKEIYDVINDTEVIYYSTSNFGSSRTSRADRLYSGGSLGINIQGQDMTAYVWDGGAARSTHVEFPNNKVIIADGASIDNHATHVTGTVVAQGITPSLRGIAFEASAVSYNWTNDYSEMSIEAAGGMLVSNHSYWIGSNSNTWMYGSYDNRARGFDQIAVAAPYYLGVTAAGNDRNDFSDPILLDYLTSKGGYNLTRGMQNAKNFLTVGAVNQVVDYTGPDSVIMSNFSSWGPTDDGRIKPDIVAKGVSVRSTISSSDTANGVLQGTSMASPAVAGSSVLLQQLYFSLFDAYMRAATLKGLILHTASEAGVYDGPDYEYGWGLINTEKAASLLLSKQISASIVDELILNNSSSYSFSVQTNASGPLSISISWTDPAGVANTTSQIDPSNLNLINDLDLRVAKGSDVYFPWTLNPANPSDGAIRTVDNFRDNFEKVQIDDANGIYNVTVSHKGSLSTGSQRFSIIVSSDNGVTRLSNDLFNFNNSISLYPNPAKNTLNVNINTIYNNATLSIVDLQGRLIKSQSLLDTKTTIDVANLQSGVYIVKVDSSDGSYTKKFIKE